VTQFAQQFRVSGTPLLYAGRARKSSARPNRSGLRYRIGKLLEFGAGRPGRALGRPLPLAVEGSEEFVLAWRPAPDGASPAHEEAELIAEFDATFARLPFANIKLSLEPVA
jgi:hypothetical protein